ncbi:MAG: hypothetical protein AAFX87_20915 [Bacteroidota bacterium]
MIHKVSTPYFARALQFVSPVLIIFGGYQLWLASYILGAILILLGLVLITTRYITAIDIKKKQIEDYLEVLTFKANHEVFKFSNIEKIIITKEDKSYRDGSLSRDRVVTFDQLTGTLVYDGGQTFELLTKLDRDALIDKMREFAKFLNTYIEDHTTGKPIIIK